MISPPTVRWRKSSHSGDQGSCVEIAAFPSGTVGVRDSKNPAGPHLALSRRAFRAFLHQTATNAPATGR